MKKTTLISLIVIILIVAGAFFFFKSGSSFTGNVIGGSSESVQKITLGIQDYNYYPRTIKVKAGEPVEVTLDSSVQGCLRSFTIKDLDVQGYSKSPADKIIFTPNKKGTFRFACSMGMGYGTIIVE